MNKIDEAFSGDSASDAPADGSGSESLWLPYSIILVSTFPIHVSLSTVVMDAY